MRSGMMFLACFATAISAAEGPQNIGWDMDSFAKAIQPMKHDMKGRLPLLLWNFPIPRNDQLVKLREDGTLRKYIDLMAQRGIVPTVEMGWEWTPGGAMAMAQTLHEAGRPVHVLIPEVPRMEDGLYEKCPAWSEGPDASRRGEMRKWPCLPLYDPTACAGFIGDWMGRFKAAGVKVSAVWFDYECLPHPWNGVYESQRDSPECRKHYPPGVLDSFERFKQYAINLRSELLSAAIADPVHKAFPEALVSNYGEFSSSVPVPFVEAGGTTYPPRLLLRLDATMPSAYANTSDLPRYIKPDEMITQEKADQVYFFMLLRSISSAQANKEPGKRSIPYISRAVRDNPDPRLSFSMSQPLYRELIRHVLLRGADGLYLFNLGYPGSTVTAEFSFESVEDARSVCDELLAYREFLDKGNPMSFACPPLYSPEPVWSGLSLADRCLVRAVTLGTQPRRLELEPFPGVKVTLEASPEGKTYLIQKDGKCEKVQSGRI